jgi:hypothetical protein
MLSPVCDSNEPNNLCEIEANVKLCADLETWLDWIIYVDFDAVLDMDELLM